MTRYRDRATKNRYCPPFTPMVNLVPEMEREGFLVKHIEVADEDIKRVQLRSIIGREYREYYDFEKGRYVQLQRFAPGRNGRIFGSIMMSDTPMERRTNLRAVELAKGDVLIAGLGIGMILYPILHKPDVRSITVIENAEPVIDMIGPLAHQWAKGTASTLKIVPADIFEWSIPEGAKWDTIYFDIWDDICADNYPEMKRLTRKFLHRRNPGGWMGAWRKADVRESATGQWRDDHDEGFVK